MPNRELLNQIAWSYTRFVDFEEYINHDQYFGRICHAEYILSSAVAIPVTSFQCDEQAVHIVCCTVSQ